MPDPKISSQILFFPLYTAYEYAKSQKSPDYQKPSCLQGIINAYEETLMFYQSVRDDYLSNPQNLLEIQQKEPSEFSKSQLEQMNIIGTNLSTFFLRVLEECDAENSEKEPDKFQECVATKKTAKIEDSVYNSSEYRNYCAYR